MVGPRPLLGYNGEEVAMRRHNVIKGFPFLRPVTSRGNIVSGINNIEKSMFLKVLSIKKSIEMSKKKSV